MQRAARTDRAIVVGCGVIGITTALGLHELGYRVEIWTRDDPWATTSSVAGAIWYPFLAEPRQRVLHWSAVTFARLRELADQPGTGVRMCDVLEVFDEDQPDLWWADAVPETRMLPPQEVPPGYRSAVSATVPVCDVPQHLAWLLAELGSRGIDIARRNVGRLEEVLAEAALVANCSGLGARELCGDGELQPVRGQVLRVSPVEIEAAWIDDTTTRPRYVIPHERGMVVGGTAQGGDERLAPDDADTERILQDAVRSFPQLRSAKVEQVLVGMRPYRSTVRLELERRSNGRIVHNYGHGGSGYTVCWGCAEELVSLVRG